MSSAPGWHPDPWDPQSVRWWDGQQWTGHTRPGVAPPVPRSGTPPPGVVGPQIRFTPTAAQPIPTPRRTSPWLGLVVVLFLAGGCGALIAAGAATDDERSTEPAAADQSSRGSGEVDMETVAVMAAAFAWDEMTTEDRALACEGLDTFGRDFVYEQLLDGADGDENGPVFAAALLDLLEAEC
jgi:hypothetical protein